MKKKRKWIKWVILAAIVLLVAMWLILVNRTSESVAYSQMTAQQGDLTTYFNFDGTVRAKRSQTITAQAADTVKTVYVAQNAQVKKDDRLYKTESGLTVRVSVSVGVSDGVYCEITEGLKPGDTVLVPSGMSMQQIMEQMRDARMGK